MVVGISGEPGSFFTNILGAELAEAFREALGGEDFPVCFANDLVGLRLWDRGCVWLLELAFGVAEGAVVVDARWAAGDEDAAGSAVLRDVDGGAASSAA